MITIRPASPEDCATIAVIRAQSWQAAYDGIIPAGILASMTSQQSITRHRDRLRQQMWKRNLLAEAVAPDAAGSGQGARAVGFASFGPERGADGETGPPPGAGPAGPARAELYAIYVVPGMWSAGAGRALMAAVAADARSSRYAGMSLWVLEENSRARRFYERAGFAVTGERQVLESLGSVTEIRYLRPFAG